MGKPYKIDSIAAYKALTGREPAKEIKDGRDTKTFLRDVTLHQTMDGKPMWTKAHERGYLTNGLPTPWRKVRVENKYGSGEVTAFVGANYRTKAGEVKNFQAHFVLGEEVEMPETAIANLKRAKTFRQFPEVVDGERRNIVRQVQKYIVETL